MKIMPPESKQPLPEHATKVFSGVMFDVYQWEQELYDGTTTTFEKLKRPDSAFIYGVLDDGRILLTEQEQPGGEPFICGAGGRVEAGEEVLDGAKREFLEETGYEASDYTLWDARQPSSKIEWSIYSFIAKGLTKVADMNLDAGEKITLKPVMFDEFIDLAQDDDFVDWEIKRFLLEASLDPIKKEELRKLFAPLK